MSIIYYMKFAAVRVFLFVIHVVHLSNEEGKLL